MSDFARDLIKGRIAKVVFEQMFREAADFTVLPFGYENLAPELAQYAPEEAGAAQEAIEAIQTAPDFALISHNHDEVYLIEARYRSQLRRDDVLRQAKRIHKAWSPAHLFVATREGFYFGSVATIIKNEGVLAEMDTTWVSDELQDKFLKLIREFER